MDSGALAVASRTLFLSLIKRSYSNNYLYCSNVLCQTCSIRPVFTSTERNKRLVKTNFDGKKTVTKRYYMRSINPNVYNFSSTNPTDEVTVNQAKRLMKINRIQLIDVRDDNEVEQQGKIKNSIHIPLKKLKDALELAENEFKERYDIEKPPQEFVVCYSAKGHSSLDALDIAKKSNFKKARHLVGGYEEWKKNEGKLRKPKIPLDLIYNSSWL